MKNKQQQQQKMGSGNLVAFMARLHSFRRPTHSANNVAAGCTDRSCTTTTTGASARIVGQDDDQPVYNSCTQAEDKSMDMAAAILRRNGGPCPCSTEHAAERQFDVALAERLQHLQLNSNGGGGSAHLNWLLDACASSLSTLSSFASLLNHGLNSTPPHHHCRHQTHLIRSAEELFSLLDVCISLQHIADDADRHLLLFQRALLSVDQALQQSSGSKLRTAARRLRSSLHAIQSIASKHYRPVAEAHAALLLAARRSTESAAAAPRPTGAAGHPIINQAFDATLLLSLLVLASALCSFAAPTKCSATRAACKVVARYLSAAFKNGSSTRSSTGTAAPPSWVAAFRQLQCDLKQQDMSAAFLQLQALHASASSLYAAITSTTTTSPLQLLPPATLLLRHSVDNLRKTSQELQTCISTLRSHLDSLFEALLALRLALLR